MRAWARRRAALAVLVSGAVAGSLTVGIPAYGQSQTGGVSNSGTASASTGGNASAGNSSSNVSANTHNQTSPPTTSVPVLGSVLGLVLNLSTSSGNASDGTSTINTGPATASGNTSDSSVGQTRASSPGGGSGPIVLGSIYNPFINPFFVPPPDQSATASNSGAATASTGGNSGVGNNSTNVASNTNSVNAGLIAIGLQLGNTASNTSNGTSTINTGAANASGNQSTTAIDQTRLGGAGGGPFFGVGAGVQCDGFFRFEGQRANVGNTGTARADTGQNASVGNQSQNVATNQNTVNGGLITLDIPGLLSNTTANNSDGTSNITTGAATASGNRSTTEIDQACVQQVRAASPPPVHPGFGFHGGIGGAHPDARFGVLGGAQARPQQLARTGRDPFVMGLIAFALLFGGLMFMVWERVESYPKRTA